VAHQRGLSDHVPVMLHVDASNWGPRPLRIVKCWSELPGYAELFREIGLLSVVKVGAVLCYNRS